MDVCCCDRVSVEVETTSASEDVVKAKVVIFVDVVSSKEVKLKAKDSAVYEEADERVVNIETDKGNVIGVNSKVALETEDSVGVEFDAPVVVGDIEFDE